MISFWKAEDGLLNWPLQTHDKHHFLDKSDHLQRAGGPQRDSFHSTNHPILFSRGLHPEPSRGQLCDEFMDSTSSFKGWQFQLRKAITFAVKAESGFVLSRQAVGGGEGGWAGVLPASQQLCLVRTEIGRSGAQAVREQAAP